jgi:hypothetical protein
MSKTVRELAEQFDVSKQAINKRLTNDFRRQHVTTKTSNGVATLLIDKTGEMLLYKAFKGNNAPTQNDKQDQQLVVGLLSEQLEHQKRESAIKNEQLAAKDEQLKTMQKLLDQSQQLQLIAEKKIESLQQPATSKMEEEGKAPQDAVVDESTKKGFWARLFG